MPAETHITNLLYRYAERIDSADLTGAAALFEHAQIRIGNDDMIDGARLLVLQQTEELPLQTIVAGRYRDRFECVEGQWRFCYRDLTLIDMVGDVSHHLTYPITPSAIR